MLVGMLNIYDIHISDFHNRSWPRLINIYQTICEVIARSFEKKWSQDKDVTYPEQDNVGVSAGGGRGVVHSLLKI